MSIFIYARSFLCKKSGYAVCLCAAVFILSCSQSVIPFFGTHEKVDIHVPAQYRTQAWTNGKAGAYLLYTDGEGAARKIPIGENNTEIRLVLPKNRVTPFLFYAAESDTTPFGCIYPFSAMPDACGGFTAFILYRLYTDGDITYEQISRFNWVKFDELIRKRETPWILDDVLIIKKIKEGTFSTRYIKKKKTKKTT